MNKIQDPPMRDGLPIFMATKKDGQLVFRCPKCGEVHYHSLRNGHRVSHCTTNCWPRGYFIQQKEK